MNVVRYDITREGLNIVYPNNFPKVICLCGSTRFAAEFNAIAIEESLKCHIVVRPEVVTYEEATDPQKVEPDVKEALDALHFHKIEMADEILVINKDGYIGWSTRNEIEYAEKLGKVVRYYYETA